MGTLFVNKSGRAFKITRTNGGSDVIGTLPVNAIFAWTDSWAGNGAGADYQGIYCNGMYGWIDGATGTGAFTPLTECGLYPSLTVVKPIITFVRTICSLGKCIVI